jgi:membrane-bound metal-dependent hydrolase YbcI (DUF457 family)
MKGTGEAPAISVVVLRALGLSGKIAGSVKYGPLIAQGNLTKTLLLHGSQEFLAFCGHREMRVSLIWANCAPQSCLPRFLCHYIAGLPIAEYVQ